MAPEPLVDFEAALDLILRLAFVPGQFDAVDAAVADVDEVEIIDEAAEESGAACRIGADAVTLQRKELLVGEGDDRACRQRAERDRRCDREMFPGKVEGHMSAPVR